MTSGAPCARDGSYQLVCTGCGLRLVDDGTVLECPACADGSLLRTDYGSLRFKPEPGASGIFRYGFWLPACREVPGSSAPHVFRSERLAMAVGLSDLWISFSGFWPERNCRMESGTFKELEAYSVLARVPEGAGTMVVASAGNTAAAFLSACRNFPFPCVLVVPESALPALNGLPGTGSCARVIALKGADYNQAIAYSKRIIELSPEFFAEGGVRNVGRRDGLATVTLAAYEAMGRLPDYYVQAVGSGAGAIATYEAATRIARSATTATTALPRLILCQNTAFAPIHDLWNHKTPHSFSAPPPPTEVYAPELVNSAPPYWAHGGIRDILTRTRGDVLTAGRRAADEAAAAFEELEGVDIERPAAVALACLRQAVAVRRIPRDARVLLNVTGGGRRRIHASTVSRRHQHPPIRLVSMESDPEAVMSRTASRR
ncbi:cysteate synthase [Streptomyces sp. WAC 01529]|uniref:cysteate synthase n=1 Tax=Streptomyces sp. WAC 01529 TaxID=2203205 RepID=UPI000F6BFE0D|nr:cysteate synthase [Streptomyces sp. WAC 01529]AZM57068.1 cysteate synthase [Streptomyces sp. WAC 01529]